MSSRFRLPVVALMLLLACPVSRADDWPQWRGLHRDGAWNETGIVDAFPAGGLKIRWRVPVGWGYSSTIVAQGRVYVTDAEIVGLKARERIHCFDERTGKVQWDHAYDVEYAAKGFIDETQKSGPAATPIVRDGKLYTLGRGGHLFCFDAIKGNVLWWKDLDKDYPAKALTCNASPLIEGDLLILFVGAKPDACVIALDRNTGTEVWKSLDEPVTSSSPIVITAGGKRQLIVWTGESLTSLDPATGKVYWRQRLATATDYVVSTPIFFENRLLIGGLMLKLNEDKPGASILWPATRATSYRIYSNTSTALFHGSHIFSAKSSGELVCIDATTGEQVWETNKVTDIKGGASIHVTPNGDSAWLFTEKGELIRARLTAEGYKELGRATLLEPTFAFGGRKCVWAAPAFANRHIFARSDKELVCASLGVEP